MVKFISLLDTRWILWWLLASFDNNISIGRCGGGINCKRRGSCHQNLCHQETPPSIAWGHNLRTGKAPANTRNPRDNIIFAHKTQPREFWHNILFHPRYVNVILCRRRRDQLYCKTAEIYIYYVTLLLFTLCLWCGVVAPWRLVGWVWNGRKECKEIRYWLKEASHKGGNGKEEKRDFIKYRKALKSC